MKKNLGDHLGIDVDSNQKIDMPKDKKPKLDDKLKTKRKFKKIKKRISNVEGIPGSFDHGKTKV